ncbi:hypothetical protein ASZ90_018862 [hydrocarbon metagenome]|uniref:UPF0033 domain-containing protein n=1 Tax=hydrocarbon metagenome TaxID=938273 RepID=A0A0W8E4Y0_9ZZZZ
MSKIVDARGLDCPQPVILTKRAMDEGEGITELVTIVDRDVARENVKRLAQSQGYECNVEQKDGDYHIHMLKTAVLEQKDSAACADIVILIKSDLFGEGDPELGQVLMKGFLYTLNELEAGLKALIFMNKGIFLTIEGSPVLEHIQALEKKGVEVLSCGTCLDFYQKTQSLAAGKITNMYTAVETMSEAAKTITI